MKNYAFLLLAFFIIGCQEEDKKGWVPLLSGQKWYQDIKGKEKKLSGKIFDKGRTRWIVKGDIKNKKGLISEEELIYKKGEEYNRFLFETAFTIYDLYLPSFWEEKELEILLELNKPEGAKKLLEKKVEIIGKERIVIYKEGGKTLKRREFIPGMVRIR